LVSEFHDFVDLFIMIELLFGLLQILNLLFIKILSKEFPVLIDKVTVECGSGKHTILFFVVLFEQRLNVYLDELLLEYEGTRGRY